MCGRYFVMREGETLKAFLARLVRHLQRERGLDCSPLVRSPWPEHRRHYNVTPTSHMPMVRVKNGTVSAELAHWQILPDFGRERTEWRLTSDGERSFRWLGQPGSHFNSRKDTLLRVEPWRRLLHAQRCLVPADGFIEWPDDALRDKSKPKVPHAFTLKSLAPFCFAGIYAETRDDEGRNLGDGGAEGRAFLSFNIISVEPNALLRSLPHHRMPAILRDEDAAAWLDPLAGWRAAARLLQPLPAEAMRHYPLGDGINRGQAEGPELLRERDSAAAVVAPSPSAP